MDKPRAFDWIGNLDRLRSLITEATGQEANDGEVSRAFLEKISRRVGRTFPPSIRDELSPDAIMSLLVERVDQYRPEGKPFSAWCYTVLKNRAISLQRRLGRDAMGQSATGQAGAGGERMRDRWGELDPLEPDSRLDAEFQSIRSLLDRVSWEPEGAERVDYFAVFLVQLRLILRNRLHKFMIEEELCQISSASEFIAYCLPWRPSECERSFKLGGASLGQVWGALAGPIDRPETPFSSDQYLAVLGMLHAGIIGLTADLWNQWTKRAKDKVKLKAGPESWDRALGRWFPDRSRSCRSVVGTTETPR